MDALAILIEESNAEQAWRLLGKQPEFPGPVELVLCALVRQEAASDIILLENGGEPGLILRMIVIGGR